MRQSVLLLLFACSGDPKTGSPEDDTALGDTEPQFSGPFVYDSADTSGVWMIDTLWIVSEQAVDEMAALGDTPLAYLDWRIDDMNDTLTRSLIDSSRVRSLGVHVLQDDDYEQTGVGIGDTSVNISNALNWLGSYREVYGADKVMIVAGTEEGASGAALGGGDVSAHWVTFLPVEHEFGHQMGGSHCNKGDAGALNFGYPASGYTEDGFAVSDGPVSAGTRMCGNSIALFSNPDVRLTLDEVEQMVADGLAPDGDWAALVDEDDGRIPMGDAQYANMAAQWRSVEQGAAENLPTRMYDGEAGAPYEEDGCIALYAEEGYGSLRRVVCAGEQLTDLGSVASVQVGAGAHVNLYSDPDFGAGSMCGGQVLRLGYSTPSLDALTEHLGAPPLTVGAVLAYEPTDRDAHRYADSPYQFYGNGASPTCPEDALLLMPDNRAWSATAAVYQEPVKVPFAVDFTVTSSHDDGGKTPPADAMTFFFAKSPDAYEVAPVSRDQLGVAADGTGYAVELNVWTNTVGLRDGDWQAIGTDLSYNTFTDGAPVPVRIEVRTDEVIVYWDGTELFRADVDVDTTYETVGFSSATGAYTIEYRLDGITYTAL